MTLIDLIKEKSGGIGPIRALGDHEGVSSDYRLKTVRLDSLTHPPLWESGWGPLYAVGLFL